MKVARIALATLVSGSFALLAIGAAACGSFSTEDAQARCDAEELARAGGGCFTAVAYDECVAAYEECGNDVNINDGCPLKFTCPE